MTPCIEAVFHEATYTVSYLVFDPIAKEGAVIDPVLDFDAKSGRTGTASADGILAAAKRQGVRIVWILETHAHADHLSAAAHLRRETGAPVAIGAEITKVQATFKALFNAADVTPDGHAFDRLLHDGDRLPLGEFSIEAMHTPGHTPACVTYRVGDAAFVGDTLFMPDYGTARADFPGGDARTLYRSIRRILDLPPETRLFMCHDYKAPGRDYFSWETTVAEERAGNEQIRDGIGEDAYVRFREARDKQLEVPALILPSLQVNIRAGNFPPPDDNGTVYLRLPIDRL